MTNAPTLERRRRRRTIQRSISAQAAGPFAHYWFRQTLDASADAGEWINFNWPVTLALALAWLLSYLCLFKGLSSSKRVVYITFTFPYVILTIFFAKALQLRGAADGVAYLFEPDVSTISSSLAPGLFVVESNLFANPNKTLFFLPFFSAAGILLMPTRMLRGVESGPN